MRKSLADLAALTEEQVRQRFQKLSDLIRKCCDGAVEFERGECHVFAQGLRDYFSEREPAAKFRLLCEDVKRKDKANRRHVFFTHAILEITLSGYSETFDYKGAGAKARWEHELAAATKRGSFKWTAQDIHPMTCPRAPTLAKALRKKTHFHGTRFVMKWPDHYQRA